MDDSDVDMSAEQLTSRVDMAERTLFHAQEAARYVQNVYKNYDAKLASLLTMYEGRKAELVKDQLTWQKQSEEANAKLAVAQKSLDDAKVALAANKKLSVAAREKLDADAKAAVAKQLADQEAKYNAVRKKLAEKAKVK